MPSERNPDDEPLRRCSDLDCTPSPESWSRAERFVGPQSFYLMAVDSNCQKDFRVNFLPHYAPWPTPGSDGVNHFATPLFLDLIFIRFRRLYSLVHFCLTFSIKILMVPSNLSCQICDRGRSGGRLFTSRCWPSCCLARRDLSPCCFFLPETHANGFLAAYGGNSRLSDAFLRGRLLFFLGFKALEGCSAMPNMSIPKRMWR